MLKRVTTVLAAVALAATANAVLASPASASSYGCNGTLVHSWPVPMKDRLDGKTYYRSDIKLYYDASNGWNCAALVKRPGKPRYGEKTPMLLEMYNARWTEDNPGRWLYHCHVMAHQMAGMAGWYVVDP